VGVEARIQSAEAGQASAERRAAMVSASRGTYKQNRSRAPCSRGLGLRERLQASAKVVASENRNATNRNIATAGPGLSLLYSSSSVGGGASLPSHGSAFTALALAGIGARGTPPRESEVRN